MASVHRFLSGKCGLVDSVSPVLRNPLRNPLRYPFLTSPDFSITCTHIFIYFDPKGVWT